MNRQQALMQAVAEYDDGTFQADLARRVAFRTESEEAGQAAAQHAYLRDDMAPLLAGLGFACRIHDNPAGADLPILVARRIEDPPCPPCCCMDTATWCAATRRAGTPAAIPGRCASRATAGTGAAPPTTRASTASTWPRCPGHRRAAAGWASTPSG